MTVAKMALLELVEQEADADLVREMLAFAAERMGSQSRDISLVSALNGEATP